MLLGPLALANTTTRSQSSMLALACEATDIMLIVARMMQMWDVKSHGKQAIFCSNHFCCGLKSAFRACQQMQNFAKFHIFENG
jgi:hypothetical protein